MSLRRLPANPHYLEFRGKPTVLITSAEHYGAVLNLDFDYLPYLDELAACGMNLTRIFTGSYREIPGSFGISHNTLGPKPNRFICPWKQTAPATDSRHEQYDLDQWDPAYFQRLRDFVDQAGQRGIVVELVLFCFWYSDQLWQASPMHPANNGGKTEAVERHDVYRLKQTKLLDVQLRMTERIVEALAEFDNVYYEIANEPYSFHDHQMFEPWHQRITERIIETEDRLGVKHLIAWNVQNRAMRVTDLPSEVDIINFHYALPAAVGDNYHLDRVIADDETGFKGQAPEAYRREAWAFMLAGGGIFSHLDYSFTTDSPDGRAPIVGATPGYGGPDIRAQFGVLKQFMAQLPLERMRPFNHIALMDTLFGQQTQILADPGREYAMYIQGAGPRTELRLGLMPGVHRGRWINPATGNVLREFELDHPGGPANVATPIHGDDLALLLRRTG